MNGKKITSSVLAAVMLAGTTGFSALAEMPDKTVVIGEKAFALGYANAEENKMEIMNAVKNKGEGKIYVKAMNKWFNNDKSTLSDTSVIPAVDYKNAEGEDAKYEAGDGEVSDGVSTEFKVVDVSAINPTTIKVTYNKPADDGVVVTLKKGLVPYNTTNTWNEDRTSVELKSSFNLPAGDYSIAITGLDNQTVSVDAEKAVSLTVKNPNIEKKAAANLALELLNQYNEAMTLNRADFTITAYNTTANVAIPVSPAKFELDLSNAKFEKDDQVVVTIVHNKTGLSVIQTLTVVNEAINNQFKFGTVIIPENQTKIYAGDTNVEIEYTLLDQYGNNVTLAANQAPSATIDGVTFVSTDTTVVNPATFSTDADGKLTFTAGSKGTATITALVAATGNVSTLVIDVVDSEAVETFTASAPASLVVASEDVVIPFVAVDQFGAQIKAKDISAADRAKVTFSTSNTGVIATSDFSFNADGELVLNATGAGSATIYVYFNGALQNSISFNVEEAAVATRITAVKDIPALFEADTTAVKVINKDNLTVVDQYNRVMTLTNEQVNIVAKDGTANIITVDGASFTVGGADEDVQFAGTATAGTEIFTISINGVTGSAIDVTMGTVESANIVTYELQSIEKLYGVAGHDKDSIYATTLVLEGKTSAGKAVALKPGKITNITSTNTVIGTDLATTKIFATDEGTAKVAVWSGAKKLAEIDVTATKDAPMAKTASFSEKSVTVAQGIVVGDANKAISGLLKIEDQYKVNITTTASGIWTSSDSSVVYVDASGNTVSPAAGTATLGYVTSNGLVTTIEVTVK